MFRVIRFETLSTNAMHKTNTIRYYSTVRHIHTCARNRCWPILFTPLSTVVFIFYLSDGCNVPFVYNRRADYLKVIAFFKLNFVAIRWIVYDIVILWQIDYWMRARTQTYTYTMIVDQCARPILANIIFHTSLWTDTACSFPSFMAYWSIEIITMFFSGSTCVQLMCAGWRFLFPIAMKTQIFRFRFHLKCTLLQHGQ